MNLPNKITMSRIFLSLVLIIILVFPFDSLGISTYKLFIAEKLVVDVKYLIAGVLFIIASLTDFVDGYIARKYNMVTDFAIIPVVIVTRDIVVDTIKMIAGSKGKVVAAIKTGKIKTIFMMIGITLTLFYNLPFELINIRVSDILIIIATVLSLISGIQYYQMNKKLIFSEK